MGTTITTYATLQTAVANWLARDDLTTYIPDFIAFGELTLRRRVRTLDTETQDTMATVAGTATVTLPTTFTSARALWINDYAPLEYRTPDVGNFEHDTTRGQPVEFTIIGSNFHFFPTPDGAYTINRVYMAAPTPLSDSNTSNAWITNAPDALLYGSLCGAAPFLGQDQRLAVWRSEFERCIMELEGEDAAKRYPQVAAPMRLSRRRVY